MRELAEQERALVPAAGRVDVQRDHGDEHQQPAEQAVQQELDRRVLALADAVTSDHEVHRDEHGLEEDVEQEDVGRGEDADHHRLQHEQQREVGLHAAPRRLLAGRARAAFGVVPRGEHHDRHQHGRHQDEDQRDAVHADRVVHAELRYPLVGLGELEIGTARGEAERHRDRDRERDQRDHQRYALDELVPPALRGVAGRSGGRHGSDHHRAGQRNHARDGQPGKCAHGIRSLTRSIASPEGARRRAAPRRRTSTMHKNARIRSASCAACPRCRPWWRPAC